MDTDFEGVLAFFKELGPLSLSKTKLAFEGDLGLGKTFLIKALLELMDPHLPSQAASPSFALCLSYQSGPYQIDHFDLYRLENQDQLDEIGLWESLEDPDRASWIEWAGKYNLVLRACDLVVTLTESQGQRAYQITRNPR